MRAPCRWSVRFPRLCRRDKLKLDVVCARRLLQCLKLRRCTVHVCKGRQSSKSRHCFDQKVLSFSVKVDREVVYARGIALRPRQRLHEAGPKQIVHYRNNRNCLGRLLRGASCFISCGCDDVDPCTDQLRRILRKQINLLPECAPFDGKVLPLDETVASKFLQEGDIHRHIARMAH
jgi:hypothetical protein